MRVFLGHNCIAVAKALGRCETRVLATCVRTRFHFLYNLSFIAMNTKKRCLGLTRNLRRCGRIGNWHLFCDEHAKQPIIWASFLIFTVASGIFSILGFFSTFSSKGVESIIQEPPPVPLGKTLSGYNDAEQHILDVSSEEIAIEGRYERLTSQPNEAPGVNKDARQVADRLIAVDDSSLGISMAIFKYQSIAYAWAMVLGSESESRAKLTAIREILDAAEKAEALINEVKMPRAYNQQTQNARDWLIKDNAVPRLKRLSAVALCARWQVEKADSDRAEVNRILSEMPYDYLLYEKPKRSAELIPCLDNFHPN
jgi:hypothetical protein